MAANVVDLKGVVTKTVAKLKGAEEGLNANGSPDEKRQRELYIQLRLALEATSSVSPPLRAHDQLRVAADARISVSTHMLERIHLRSWRLCMISL
jgi:hypothetical protein